MEGLPLINTYCDRPWTELHIEEDGSVTPCCVMPSNRFPMGKDLSNYINGNALKELKEALLSGIQHANCQNCWDNEKHKLKSHRITKPRDPGLSSIHIRLNNVCNFKCRICNPSFSSTWAQENKKHNFFKAPQEKIVKDAIEENGEYLFKVIEKGIKAGTLTQLNISGGEPLITDAHFKLLSFLIDNNLTNINLSYSTNLSNLDYKGIDLIPLWEKFSNVSIEASLDGWGDAVEYSRTGLDLNSFMRNFIRAFRYISAINCVVSVYSVWTLPYVEKFRKHGKNIVYSPCYLPIYTNPQLLMREDKEALLKLYEPYPELVKVYQNFIDTDLDNDYNYPNSNDKSEVWSLSKIRQKMVTYNLLLDSYRSTSFFEVFPMYRKYEKNG